MRARLGIFAAFAYVWSGESAAAEPTYGGLLMTIGWWLVGFACSTNDWQPVRSLPSVRVVKR